MRERERGGGGEGEGKREKDCGRGYDICYTGEFLCRSLKNVHKNTGVWFNASNMLQASSIL